MINIKIIFQKHWYVIFFILVMLIAVVLRFYQFSSRWGLGYDQAHDVIIARYALAHAQLPLLGPFSSAGPFQTGGEWYWIIMLGSLLFPFFLTGPWIFLAIVQTLLVAFAIYVGQKLMDKKFGILVGFFAAVSPAQVSQSVNLTNQAPIAIFSLASIWATIQLIRTKKAIYGFLLGLFIATATSIHTQGISLMMLIIATIIFARIPIKNYVFLIVGFVIPFLPIFLAESAHGFFNTKGMMQYYLHDQYRISLEALGRRWLTYLVVLWPNTISNIIGGLNVFGYLACIMIPLAYLLSIFRKELSREWAILGFSLLGFVVALRYVHTPLFDSYFMFANPFIFLLLSWSIFVIFRTNMQRKLAAILVLFIIAGSLWRDSKVIALGENTTQEHVIRWGNALQLSYPNKKFDLYDYQYRSSSYTFPLMLSLQYKNLLDDNGQRIAFGKPTPKENKEMQDWFPPVAHNTGGFDLLDAESSTSAQLSKAGWSRISPEIVYKATQLWYIKK